jgi:hypothetical protein
MDEQETAQAVSCFFLCYSVKEEQKQTKWSILGAFVVVFTYMDY